MAKYTIIAATGCPTGIAHTYMAKDALEQAAKKRNVSIKVETHGQAGTENELTPEEIKAADGVIIAADKDVQIERFSGKRLINVSVSRGMKDADELINQILTDDTVPVFRDKEGENAAAAGTSSRSASNGSFWHGLYVDLMNGVSHMLPFVVAGGVLVAVSFFWGIYSSTPGNAQYNSVAALLNTIGGFSMNLMVPVLCAFIAEAIAKRAGLTVGFVVGMIAYTNGTGFLGGIVGGFLAGYVILLLQVIFKKLPKVLDGLKQIFIFPVLGVLIAGAIMWFLSAPMKYVNTGMMSFLKGMENANPIILGIIVGCMAAADMGGPINKAAYLTGVALLGQGNYFFMAGVSAACIAPPLATGFAVLFNKKAFNSQERNAGYVNFLLGSTHITEGAIPFAAKMPLINLPSFMIGSSIAAALSYVFKISDPAPHGGFIILPLVNHPFLWVIFILIGALVSGVLLALSAERQYRRNGGVLEATSLGIFSSDTETASAEEAPEAEAATSAAPVSNDFSSILKKENIVVDLEVKDRDELLNFLSKKAVELGYSNDSLSVYKKYLFRESQSSTGMEDGIAIPHAQDESINSAAMLIAKLKNPIEWETFDKQPVDTVISFLIPNQNSKEHLQFLANTSTLLMNKDFVKTLKATSQPEEILNLFIKS